MTGVHYSNRGHDAHCGDPTAQLLTLVRARVTCIRCRARLHLPSIGATHNAQILPNPKRTSSIPPP